MPKLTAKQSAFVDEYLKMESPCAMEAYKRAGYSAKSAKSNSHRMMDNEVIKAAIAERMAERAERCQVDQDYVLNTLVEMRELDFIDIMGDEGGFKPISEWPKPWRQSISAIEVRELYEYVENHREVVGQVTKVKFIDKARILEMIGKHTSVRAWDKDIHLLADGIEMHLHY